MPVSKGRKIIVRFLALNPLVMMFSAYTILLGHSIIPHHHHQTLHEATLHHLYEHTTHHHDDGEAEGHEHTPHLVHSDFAEDFRTSASSFVVFSKQIISLFNFSPFTFSLIAEVNSCLEIEPPKNEFLIYSSPHSLESGLRAPPVFIS